MPSTEEHITHIETKLAYLEDFLNKIQAITVEHAEAIDRIYTENRALKDKLGEIDDMVQDMPHVRPPHY